MKKGSKTDRNRNSFEQSEFFQLVCYATKVLIQNIHELYDRFVSALNSFEKIDVKIDNIYVELKNNILSQ